MKKNKIIDLFCGCGGLSLGFEQAGFEIEIAIDKWEDAISTYNYNRKSKIGKNMNIEDLSNKYLLEIKDKIIGVIGGPPCQGFSTVGTRNINDSRNHLYKEYCRVVEIISPEFFIIENVKGILTLGNGFFKEDILTRFKKMGYNVCFKLLNASNYGVPQNRQRVFFVGLKNSKFNFDNLKILNKISTSMALSDLPSLDNLENPKIYKASIPLNKYQEYLRKNSTEIFNNDLTKHTEQTKNIISKIKDGGSIKDLPKEFWEVRKYNKAFQRMNSLLPSNTIDTGHRNYFHYKENRVPTVRECARIQSFPDNFIFLGSKTSQYKQVGNAVPPLLAYEIAKNIYQSI